MKIYISGIGGIGTSALARYYLANGHSVSGSDSVESGITKSLQDEGIDVKIGVFPERITPDIDLVVSSEAVPSDQGELVKARELEIETMRYNKALGNITKNSKLIAIAGTHGKSTTTSLLSLIFRNTNLSFFSIIGTLLKEFGNKNFYQKKTSEDDKYSIIEACEYKRHFLLYSPYIAIITNIELDHLDYYEDLDDYISAFTEFVKNIQTGGYLVTSNDVYNKLTQHINLHELDINIALLNTDLSSYSIHGNTGITQRQIPNFKLKVPGSHIYYDALLAAIAADIACISESTISQTLGSYKGVWRRMELLGYTNNNNLVISDYGHHPTEIKATLKAIKNHYTQKKIITIFQPHQYSRTIELFDDFIVSFDDTDVVIIPNIYASRDNERDKEACSAKYFTQHIKHDRAIYSENFDKTISLIDELDKEYNTGAVFVLLGAGDIDTLRNRIYLN